MAEFYSYTEHPEFGLGQRGFEECMEAFGMPTTWTAMDEAQR